MGHRKGVLLTMLLTTRVCFVLVLMALALSVRAEEAVQADPRTTAETIVALQAMLNLRDAQTRALASDYEARLATAMEWLKQAQMASGKVPGSPPVAKQEAK
jgi:hypothetical protein